MKHPLLPIASIFALLIFLGETFFGLFSSLSDPARSSSHFCHYVQNHNVALVRLTDYPVLRNRSVRVPAEVISISSSSSDSLQPSHGKLLLYLPIDSLSLSLSKGCELVISTHFQQPSANDNPHQFNYRQHLFRKGILYTAFVSNNNYSLLHSSSHSNSWISSLRAKLLSIIRLSNLSAQQQSIAEALILGFRDDLDNQTFSDFRTAGILHLLCVSGLHVGIVDWLVLSCLFFLSNRPCHRLLKGFIRLSAIWLFTCLTGYAPSTLRAAIMFSFLVVGSMIYSRSSSINAVAASALILLLFRPLLLFDVGFQFSYLSVFAILIILPPLRLLPARRSLLTSNLSLFSRLFHRLALKLWSLFCLSFIAQLATLPLQLFYFHQFPLYFLIANLVIIPFASFILASLFLLLLFSWNSFLFDLLGKLVSCELNATQFVTHSVAQLPHALIDNIWFDNWLLLFSLLALLALFLCFLLDPPIINSSKLTLSTSSLSTRFSLSLFFCSLSFIVIYSLAIRNSMGQQRCWNFYRLGNHTAIEFFAGHSSYLVCDSAVALNPSLIDFQTHNNLVYHQTRHRHILSFDDSLDDSLFFLSNHFISFNSNSFRIIDRSNAFLHSSFVPSVDYLILSQSPFTTIARLREQYDFDSLLLSSQNSDYRLNQWIAECDSLGIPYRL